MTKLYIAEFPGLAPTFSGDSAIDAFVMPPLAEQVVNSAATTGAIGSLGAITAGTLYTNGTYPNVPLTGGTGSGATANITVAGGGVTVVTLVNAGTGYTVADSLSAAAANIGGTGSGFAIPVSTINQQSAAFQPTTKFISVEADGVCSIAIGLNPNATTSNMRLNTGERRTFGIAPIANPINPSLPTTQKISVITNT